jgi:hypothetical protein
MRIAVCLNRALLMKWTMSGRRTYSPCPQRGCEDSERYSEDSTSVAEQDSPAMLGLNTSHSIRCSAALSLENENTVERSTSPNANLRS